MTLRLEWSGWKPGEAERKLLAAGADGITKGVEHWLTESRQEAPIEEGTLERSGAATVDRRKLTGAVSYDTPYAVRQHEELEYRHDTGRKAKYLEDPGNREAPTMLALLATELRRATR